MKRYEIFALLLFAAASCKKRDADIVEKFVRELKADGVSLMITPPKFQVEHIGALLAHGGDEQLVGPPSHSSYYGGPLSVGLVMLYAIEATRSQSEWASLGLSIKDIGDMERHVPLSEVLPFYRAWWAANQGKSAAELKQLDPLAGTSLGWFMAYNGK